MTDYYGNLAGALAYHTDQGNAAWAAAATDALREAALLRASVWLDGNYRDLFQGYKTLFRAQIRQWPRFGAVDAEGYPIPIDEVPREILAATYEAALRELAVPGQLSPDFVAANRVVRERLGSLEVEYSAFATPSLEQVRPILSIIDDILAPLLGPRGSPFVSSHGRD